MRPQLLHLTTLSRVASGLGLIVTGIILSWQDLQTRYVSASTLCTFTLFSLLNVILLPEATWTQIFAGAATTGLFMMIASMISRYISGREMIGNGDVWFAFATGLAAQGAENAIDMLVTAFLLAFLPAVITVVRHLCRMYLKDSATADKDQPMKRSLREICQFEIPFFPFLTLSLFIIRIKTVLL
ncbi:MAG: prepilin peptidase [Saccharofermentanales bacterium]|jgi:prepilin signal peptidase PulO-like enzyme (type II secretory pathway)